MDDTAGKEKITIHAQYDMNTTIEHDETHTVNDGDRTISVKTGKHTETIKGDTTIKITDGNLDHEVGTGTAKYHVKGAVTEIFDDKQETTVNADIIITSKTTKIHGIASTEIQLKVGSSKLLMKSDGSIELSGTHIAIKGTEQVEIKGGSIVSSADSNHDISGALVKSEASATNTIKGAMVMLNP
jgi:type VI secretion system secreted protein VgrG